MNNLLALALIYLDRGYSVIPVGKDKRPLINWKDYQNRRATPEELVKWFTDFPEAQIGIITGQISNLTVVDIEYDGDFGLIKDETYMVETGRKGRHYYFSYDPDFQNAVKIFPSVDIRSAGGFVVAAGSTTSKGAYTVLRDTKVIQMSSFTKGTLQTQINAKKRVLPWFAGSGPSLYPKTPTDGLEYPGAEKGGRNDAMTKFAGSIMARLHPSLWQSIGWQIFQDANKKNDPPLPEYEIRATWLSISNRETQSHPGGRRFDLPQEKTWGPDPISTEFKNNQMAVISDDSMQDSVQHAKEEDSQPPVISTNIVNTVSEDEFDPKETLHVSEVAALQVIDTEHTYSINMPPFDEALLGGFTLSEVIVVAGETGTGKTTLLQDWTVTLASGDKEGNKKLPVLWFSYEVLAKPLWQKFQIMGATTAMPIYMPRLNDSGDMIWVVDVIEGAIEKWGIKVVVIDHLGFLRAPRGNYANEASAITHTVRALKDLARKRGLIILLQVHLNNRVSKTPTLNNIKDSSGIAQEASTVFFIRRERDTNGIQTNQSQLWLLKNRKTGIGASAMFDFQFGRFFYNANQGLKDNDESSDFSVKFEDL